MGNEGSKENAPIKSKKTSYGCEMNKDKDEEDIEDDIEEDRVFTEDVIHEEDEFEVGNSTNKPQFADSGPEIIKPETKKPTLLKRVTEHRRASGQDLPVSHFPEKKPPRRDSKQDEIRRTSIPDIDQEEEFARRKYRSHSITYKVSSHKNPLTREGTIFDMSTNLEMWERIVANSLMSSNHLKKVAIFNKESGGLYACSPPNFALTVQQIKALAEAVNDPGKLAVDGIQVADDFFMYKKAEIGNSLTGISEDKETFFYFRAGQTSGIAVVFDKDKRESTLKLIEELYDYFAEAYAF